MNQLVEVFNITTQSGLFFHELTHFLFTLPFLIVIWIRTKRLKFVVLALLSSYLIDLDHLFDYWGYYGLGFNLADFFKMNYFNGSGMAFVPFHAWEWLIILLCVSYKKGWRSYITPLTLGISSHLIYDAISVGSFAFYFISYRAFLGFRIFM